MQKNSLTIEDFQAIKDFLTRRKASFQRIRTKVHLDPNINISGLNINNIPIINRTKPPMICENLEYFVVTLKRRREKIATKNISRSSNINTNIYSSIYI